MAKFRKKPVEVEALQWACTNEMFEFVGLGASGDPNRAKIYLYNGDSADAYLWVDANHVWLPIEAGEWVIRDSQGFYPCKPDIFEQTYEPVDDQADEDPTEVVDLVAALRASVEAAKARREARGQS